MEEARTTAKSSKVQPKVSEDFPDIDTLPEIDLSKPSEPESQPKQEVGFYWRNKRYENETALVKAVTAEVRDLVRKHLMSPVDVVKPAGSYPAQIKLVRVELELKE